MKKALVILNKNSGKQRNRSVEEQLIHKLNAENYEVMIKYTTSGGAVDLTREYAPDKDLTVIVGGDGTISEVIEGLHKENLDIPVAVIPGGTVNDVARVHDIPLDPMKAVDGLDTTRRVRADTIKVNDQHASYLVALGAFMTTFSKVDSGVKSKIGRIAYLFAGVKMLLNLKVYPINLKADDFEIEADSVLTIISKISSVGSLSRLIRDAEPDDGLLHIINIEPVKFFEVLHIILLALTGRITTHPKVMYRTAEEAEIKVMGLEDMNIDGDTYDYEDLKISVIKEGVTLINASNIKNS